MYMATNLKGCLVAFFKTIKKTEMKNLFVPYEIALLAKEKEFDEPCLSSYNTKKQLTIASTFGLKNSDLIDDFLKYGYEVTAPLYQQIIDWFREKHKIRIIDSIHKSCMSGTLEKLYKFYIIKIDGLYTKDLLFSSSTENQYYESYYEALNKAIEEAFKLI